ncbi:hypothetical protein R3P38DRAFT_2768334 [Favolaschia claudopus]|uniref:Uncharacterized protein n=1 Tax=Favolaschia claudopus TaxID=2862362 RepID=A0AAW0CSV7_9AGAR
MPASQNFREGEYRDKNRRRNRRCGERYGSGGARDEEDGMAEIGRRGGAGMRAKTYPDFQVGRGRQGRCNGVRDFAGWAALGHEGRPGDIGIGWDRRLVDGVRVRVSTTAANRVSRRRYFSIHSRVVSKGEDNGGRPGRLQACRMRTGGLGGRLVVLVFDGGTRRISFLMMRSFWRMRSSSRGWICASGLVFAGPNWSVIRFSQDRVALVYGLFVAKGRNGPLREGEC